MLLHLGRLGSERLVSRPTLETGGLLPGDFDVPAEGLGVADAAARRA